jgi:hypothetical protein
MANLECNAVSAVQITHVFVTRMLAKRQRGCVVFTSSAAACQPCPFSCMYGATKAFVSSFGASLAVEVKTRGIDVTVVHPSPVASRFYDNAHALDSIAFFKKFNVAPDALPDLIFAAVGRCVWRDIGGVAVAFRLMMKVLVRVTRTHVHAVRACARELAASARIAVLRAGSGSDAGVVCCAPLLLPCCFASLLLLLRCAGFQPHVHSAEPLRAHDGGLQKELVRRQDVRASGRRRAGARCCY